MSFNIFGPTTKKDIRVGYIDPDRGYVENISILEANKYAALNPGTIFILKTRDATRYLTLNEVNALTPDALDVDNNVCDGIRGLRPGERAPFDDTDTGCRGRLFLSGGGGVGAVGSPIFGRDGSTLAIRVVRGGFGYKFPPKAKLVDSCMRGSGAVIKAIIGELPPTTEYFDQEEDFEIYDLTPDGTELSGYGLRYGVDGEVLGSWDPNLFATLAQDPIKNEIQRYQDFLRQGINPFWHTRKQNPLSVTFRDKSTRVIHNVTDKGFRERRKRNGETEDFGWSNWMNEYAVAPIPESNARGSDYAGSWATMEWEENFPYTGEYVFRGMADNVGRLYLDNNLILETKKFGGKDARNVGPTDVVKKTIQGGIHRIKVDLVNIPIKEKLAVKSEGSGGGGSGDLLISYRGLNSANKNLNVDGNKIKLKDGDGNDTNATFSIKSSTVNAKFSNNGKKISYVGSGKITLELKWNDNPNTAGVAVKSIEVGGKVLNQKGRSGNDSITIDVQKTSVSAPAKSKTNQSLGTIFSTTDFINKANRKLWRTNVYGAGGFLGEYGVCPFNTRQSLNDNPYAGDHIIRWDKVDFPADGNYNIDIEVDDRVKLSLIKGGDKIEIEKNGFVGDSNKGTGKSTYTKFFKKGVYKLVAELYQKPGGRFSFDGDGNPKSNRISARFVQRGGQNYLKVDGSGSAEISFRLKVDDNFRSSGVFASKVKIGLPPNDYVLLSRNTSGGNYKERETITETAFFEAGREYLISTIGSSSGTGSRIENNGNSIGYDDNIGNGFDRNGELSIIKIKNQQPSSVKGINPMALAINIVASVIEEERVVAKSFNENPMGGAFTIDAPMPPIPESPIPIGEGRCPKNPIWTTRFPGGQKKWWPVTHPAWSKFTNRFALSPLPPLSSLNSDGGGGITYENTWTLEIPYDGFYGIKGTADNAGRILIDGQEVYKFKGFKNQSPKIEKVRLTEGNHSITVEVENFRQENTKIIKKKIFSTQDWAKKVPGGGNVDVGFKVTSNAKYANSVDFGGAFSFSKEYGGSQINESTSKTLESGKVYDVVFNSSGKNAKVKLRTSGEGVVQMEDYKDNDYTDIIISASKGRFYDLNGNKCKYVVGGEPKASQASPTQNGVTYSGPEVFRYIDTRKNIWSDFMNKNNVSPFLPPLNEENSDIVGDKNFTWSNVNFPENGSYEIEFQADDVATLFIDGEEVAISKSFRGTPTKTLVNLSRGKYELRVKLTNAQLPKDIFANYNPTGFALKIIKDIVKVVSTPPWTANPLCASAIIIPPPCPKVIQGTGVITDIIVEEPGNGYPTPPSGGPPVTLVLKDVIPTSPGINYGPDDVILINGNPLKPILGPFGTVDGVEPSDRPYYGITEYPNITMPSNTGVGFRGRPVFEPVIVPELVLPDDQLLQVTDLVGLKQTGYVNGRPYYGSTFSENGILYAGVYKTTGDLIQVYATLQESVDNQVTTRASAILRQGSDVTSNDPRLNIPNTPDNLI